MMDKQREKLIELLGLYLPINVRNQRGSYDTIGERTVPIRDRERLADHLLASGVIVPPCKVGDKLYNKYSLTDDCCYWEVIKFEVYDDEIWIIDDGDNCYSEKEIGKFVFLSREDAEKALKGVE